MGAHTVMAVAAGSINVLGLAMTPSTFWILVIFAVIILTGVGFYVRFHWQAVRRAKGRIAGLNAVTALMSQGDHNGQRQAALNESKAERPMVKEVAELWGDFDSSLVASASGERLHSTEPAEEYFNSETIAPELLHGRLLPFLPSGMTAVGVLGTFVGLTFGLSGLDLGSGTNSDALRAGVSDLISGAALAFATSMLGVVASVLCNLAHNISARRITQQIRALQESADRDLHRQAADLSLVKIAQVSDEQNAALQALDEKLGIQFQKAVAGMSSDMEAAVTKALQNAIAPAMAELSSSANNQSSLVMESLVGRFAASFEDLGERQAAKLSGASEQLETSMSGMASRMESLLTDVQQAIGQSLEGTSKQADRMAEQVGALSMALAAQQKQSEETVRQLTELVERAGSSMNTSAGNLRSATASLEGVATTFSSASADLGEHLKATGHTLSSSRSHLESVGATLAETSVALNEQQKKLEGLRQVMATTSESLGSAAQLSQEAFGELEQHQKAFLEALDQKVTALTATMGEQIGTVQKDMSNWLEEYAKTVSAQTTDRMRAWNTQTEDYSSTMIEVAGELRDVVEGLSQQDGKTYASQR